MAADDGVVKLPGTVKPSHYDLHLYNLDLTGYKYDGKVEIDIEVLEDVKTITLNSIELVIKVASLGSSQLKTESAIVASDISYDEKRQEATLTFDETIKSGTKATLALVFEGLINNAMHGFYRSEYTDPGETEVKQQFSTQFEATDARRAFPCFDEPALKATFKISISHPEELTCISNMSVKDTFASTDGQKSVKTDFDTSPPMSTYLVAWVVGDLEYIEAFTQKSEYHGQKIPVRVYTTRGLKEQGRLALDYACKFLDMYEDMFGGGYGLSKLDMAAVFSFSHGAMENWGLVTYRTSLVLFEEGKTDEKYRRLIAYVVAHELAHQWFGNAVSPMSWDYLYLNEAFATWQGWYGVDQLHPEWDVWSYFVSNSQQVALGLDAVRSSHPVEVAVKDALQINEIFDHISYLKGASILRLLEGVIGTQTFINGVAKYLKKFWWGNATTNDLFASLSEESGIDVVALMSPWVLKQGFPVLTVAEEIDSITIKQERYLSTGDVKPDEDETIWTVPINLPTKNGEEIVKVLSKRTETIRDVDLSFYKLNPGQQAFCRVNYPAERLQKLGEAAATNRERLSASDRIGLVGDAAALAASGHGSTAALLNFVSNLTGEDSAVVWEEIAARFSTLRMVMSEQPEAVTDSLKSFGRTLYGKRVAELGWDFPSGESYLDGQSRALLIGAAGGCDDANIIREAKHRFEKYKKGDKSAFASAIRRQVFTIVMSHGGSPEDFDFILNLGLAAGATEDEQESAFFGIGSVRDPQLIERALKLLLSNKIKQQNIHYPVAALAANPVARPMLWDFMQRNWERVTSEFGKNPTILSRMVQYSIGSFATTARHAEIEQFFKDKNTAGFERVLAQGLDKIRGNAAWVERDAGIVAEWLHTKGY